MARRLCWHLLSIGRAWRDETEVHPARDKAGVFLFWIVSGRGAFETGGRRYQLASGGRCWLADMALPRTYLPAKGARLVTQGLRFAGPGLDVWREALGTSAEFVFDSASARSGLRRSHGQLQRLVKRRPANYEWQVHELLTQVLGWLLMARGVFASAASPRAPEPVARVLDAVLADPSRAWRAAELAGLARVGYSSLRALFRTSQQETLSAFLQRTRLDQVRLLLADDRLSVKEVASRLDFSSEFYFSHWFRRQTGLSPKRFRETLRD